MFCLNLKYVKNFISGPYTVHPKYEYTARIFQKEQKLQKRLND